MLQHRVTEVPVRKKKKLWSPLRQHGKASKMQIALNHIQMHLCTPGKQMRLESWNKFLNSICWTAHISPEVTSSVWCSYICDPNSIWHAELTFHENQWGLCGLESNISRTKIANQAEKCAFFEVLIIIGWAYWFNVGALFGVCVSVCANVCVCMSLYSCAYTGTVH